MFENATTDTSVDGAHHAGDASSVLRTLFTTAGVPLPDRPRAFDEFLTESRHGTRALVHRPDRFAARVRAVRLGGIEVSELTASSAAVARTPSLIRADDPDVYALITPVRGHAVLTQAGREAELVPGRVVLRSSGRPFELHVGEGPVRLLRAQVPRPLLTRRRRELDRLLAAPVPGDSGMGRLFTRFLRDLADGDPGGEGYRQQDLPRLANLTLDLFDALLGHVLDRDHRPTPGQPALLAQVTAHIQERLGDPDLSPDTIAAAHHISTSYLHRLFASRDLTVGATIRALRLERARRDLADPRLAGVPIHRIAARWGFRDHATFTRAFRQRYGTAPRALRPELLAS